MNTLHAPVVVVNRNIVTARDRTVHTAEIGMPVSLLAPNTALPFICYFNGTPLLRAEWTRTVCRGDVVVFQILPQGGGGGASRTLLTIALIAAVSVYAPGIAGNLLLSTGASLGSYSTYLAITQASLLVAGSTLINALVPLPKASNGAMNSGEAPSSTYNIGLQGNSARLEQPIPVVYGRNIIFCDFAAQPYSEYVDNEQFYYALLCIGQGEFEIESIKIDDTLITNFADVTTPVIVPPGGTQTLVATNILNAPEVSGQELLYDVPVGPFTACGLGRKATEILLDITLPAGLFYSNDDGSLEDRTITWKIETQEIDDFDLPVGSWNTVAFESLTLATTTAQRKTYVYSRSAARYQVRVTRTSVKEDSNRVGNILQWEAMRARLDVPGVTNTTATMLAIKMRASSQLSGISQRKINVVCTRKLPTWSLVGGWTAPVATRSIVWAFCDALRNTDYGEGRPDSRIALSALYGLDQLYSSRGDSFSGIFDSRTTIRDALSQIARAGRAVRIEAGGVMTMVRDGPQTLPVAMFTTSNIVKGSFSLDYLLRTEETADSLEMEYWEEKLWTWRKLPVVLAPGVTVAQNTAKLRYFGVTNAAQALRDAQHIVADTAFRRVVASFTTEMTGLIPGYGELISVTHDLPGWASGGFIRDWDLPTLTATLSEIPVFVLGQVHYVLLHGPTGKPYGPYQVTAGPIEDQIVFIDTPAITPYTGYDMDQTRYSFGPASNYGKLMRVIGIRPRGLDQVEIKAVVEDNRVHTADGGAGSGGGGSTVGRIAHVVNSSSPIYSMASPGQKSVGGWVANSSGTIGTDSAYITGRT